MKEYIEKFQDITLFDLSSLLKSYIKFIEEDKVVVIDYYKGKKYNNYYKSFELLESLISDFEECLNLFTQHKTQLTNNVYWDILERVEEGYSSLKKISNSPKFLRSFISKGSYSLPARDYVMKQNQTLEDVSRKLGDSFPNDDWATLAIQNQLDEEKYTSKGGTLLKVKLVPTGGVLNINSIVDTIDSYLKTYGRDIRSKITYKNNDLEVLSYQDSLNQTIKILSNFKKGTSQEFINDGLEKGVVSGSNLASFSYPIIFRQMYENFSTDDCFLSFSILGVDRDQDSLEVTYNLEVRGEDNPLLLTTNI